jgi:hypothetical protein
MAPPLKKNKNWWETYNQHDIGIDMVLADKENAPQAPALMPLVNEDQKITSPGSQPRIGPTHPNAEVRMPSGSIAPEVKVENPKGTTFTTAKVNPAVMPGEAAPALTAPPLPTNPEYDAELGAYQAEMKRGPAKQGVASQILFQAAQMAANFGRGMQGQQMQPFQWLGEAKDERRNQQAATRFAPYQAERNQQIENWKTQAGTNIAVDKANTDRRKTEAEINKINSEANRVDMEYYEAEGKRFQRRKGTNEKWEEIPELQDRTKAGIERELPDGTKFMTTGDKEADRIAEQSYRDAQLDLQKGKIAQDQLDDYRKRLEGWQKDSAEHNNKKAEIEATATAKDGEAQAKRGSADQLLREAGQAEANGDPDRAADLRKDAERLRQEASVAQASAEAARKQVRGMKAPPPPRMQSSNISTTKPTTGTKSPRKVSSSQLEQLSKQTGKSIEELKKMAKREGYSID